MHLNIIAIGGGDVGSGETEPIDLELVRLAGGTRLLFIPTASNDSEDYVEAVQLGYGRLGCEIDALRLLGKDGSNEAAKRKIEWADAIYVGGGNTKALIEVWRSIGVDQLLRSHLEEGKPVGGVSAGALCWFRVGNSDWPQFEGIEGVNTDRLECLGFVDLVLCPHCSRERFRLNEFREMMRGETSVGVGLDDCCAIQIRDDEYRILASQPDSFAHRIEWRNGQLLEQVLPPHDDFRPLKTL